MRSARWLPPEPEKEAPQRPWLEAPSPYDYEYGPAGEPRSETRHQEDEEESIRVIIIDM